MDAFIGIGSLLALLVILGLMVTLWSWLVYPYTDEDGMPVAGPGLSAVEFREQTIVIAKDQPEYRPLPAYVSDDDEHGEVITCWRLNGRDRLKLLFTGRLWASTLTFHTPLQPLFFTVDKSDVLRAVAPETPDV